MQNIDAQLDMNKNVGFVGLGNMGSRMVTKLSSAGYGVLAFDSRPEAVTNHDLPGLTGARSIADLVSEVDIICTCVLYDDQVRDVFLAEDGILAHARPGQIATIHSTILPQTVIDIAKAATDVGVTIIDAAVTLGQDRSELTLFVGGEPFDVARAMPVLGTIGNPVIHVGTAGMGQVAKMGNQIMSLGNQLLAMEAVKFVSSYGLAKEDLFRAAAAGTGASWAAANFEFFDRYRDEHTLAGTPELPHRMGKDLRYIVAAAQEEWVYLPIASLCSQMLPSMFVERWYGLDAHLQSKAEVAGATLDRTTSGPLEKEVPNVVRA